MTHRAFAVLSAACLMCTAASDARAEGTSEYQWPHSRIISVDGGLTVTQIDDVVTAHQVELLTCQKKEKPRTKRLDSGRTVYVSGVGVILEAYEIGGSGKVTRASIIRSDLNSKSMGACVVKAIRHWKFPKSPHGDSTRVSARHEFVGPSSRLVDSVSSGAGGATDAAGNFGSSITDAINRTLQQVTPQNGQ